jgi:hypothetical protein
MPPGLVSHQREDRIDAPLDPKDPPPVEFAAALDRFHPREAPPEPREDPIVARFTKITPSFASNDARADAELVPALPIEEDELLASLTRKMRDVLRAGTRA